MSGSAHVARGTRRPQPALITSPVLEGLAALLVYLLLLTVAEVAVTTVNPVLVFPLHGGLIALTGLYFVVRREFGMPAPDARILTAAAVALTVAPLIRIISLTLPLAQLEPVYRYVAAGVPMAIGGALAARAAGFDARQIGLVWSGARWQVWAVVASIALGFVEFVILRPEPLGAVPWTAAGLWPALAIGFFTGFPEELIFRGVMQSALRPILGRWNWVYVSGLFAVLHLGYASYLDVVFVFAVGLFYGWIVERTRSIVGVSVGHGVANVILFFVAPNVIDRAALPAVGPLADPLLAIALALALTTTTVVALRSRRGRGWRSLLADDAGSGVGPLRLTVVADPTAARVDAMAGIVPADRIEVPVTSRITAPATWIERRTPRARGVVRFTSRNTGEPSFVAAGTVLLSTDGQRFRTMKRAFLRLAPIGGIAIADVPVEAEMAGVEGDVPAGSIRRVPVGLAANGVTVTNQEAMTGGTRAVIRRISASDHNSARIEAGRRSWDEVRDLLAAGGPDVGGDRHVEHAATTVATTSVLPDAETAIGRQADSIELTMQRVATATVVDLGQLRTVALDQLSASVRDGFRLDHGSIEARVIDAVARGDSVIYTVEIAGRQRPIIEATPVEDYRAA